MLSTTLSIEGIVELYYQKVALRWDDYLGGNFRGFVSMDNNCKGTAEFLLQDSDRAKYIWVDRDCAGLLSTHATRKPLASQTASTSKRCAL